MREPRLVQDRIMQYFSISPREMIRSLWHNRNLIITMVKREVVGRYRGSFIGIAWSFFNPLLILAVYTFVFSVVFKARWGGGSGSKTEFALVLFAGLIVFNLFAECINRAPSLILANVNYVKKVVFPLEILPWVALGSAMFHAVISLGVWLTAYALFFGLPHVTALLLPLVFLPLALLIMGLSWILVSLGVYLRDVSQIVAILTTVLMFLSPIFYPITALPEAFRSFLLLNPLTPAIEQTRNVLFWGKIPGVTMLGVYFLSTACIAFIGFAWFQKTRKGFADVL
jgi:lipopolysaccharide transport system permease protein